MNPTHAHRPRPDRPADRRGGVYPLVLIVTAAAGTAALTGLAMRSAADTRATTTGDLTDARLVARSGIEAALEIIEETNNWRKTYGSSKLLSLDIGPGTADVSIVDEADADLSDDDNDAYTVTSVATVGDARATMKATAALVPLSFRDRALSFSPIAFWPLDESAGTFTVSALVGSQDGGYSHTVVGGQTTGPFGDPAPAFTSLANLAFVPHYGDLLLDDGTLVFHARVDKTSSGTRTLIAKDVSGDDGPGSIHIFMNGSSRDLYVRFEESSDTTTLKASQLNEGVWHQIAVTFGSGGLFVYVDGTEQNKESTWKTGLGPNAGGSGNTHAMNIGFWFNGSSFVNSLNGSVRDVIFYDSQLSKTEIEFLATDGSGEFRIQPDAWAWVVD